MINKTIVIINGSGCSGKDTFVELISQHISTTNFSSVDKVKQIAKQIGWQGGKSEKDRKFLSDLKLLTTDYNDMPFNSMKKVVDEFYKDNSNILFLHIREPNEITRAVKEFNAKTLLIKRKDIPEIKSNMADANVDNYTYDYVIHNDGSLNDFENKAKEFVYWIFEQERKMME